MRGKGIIIAVNKWDAVEKKTIRPSINTPMISGILFPLMPYAEIMFISAETGQRLPKLLRRFDMVLENQTLRVQTGVLNEIMMEAASSAAFRQGKRAETLLYHTGSGETAHLRDLCKRQRADALLLCALSGK